jgi:hypothetical protein
VLTATERHDLVLATQTVAVMNDRVGCLERWIRAWCLVADAYVREGDSAAAVDALDNGLTMWRWLPDDTRAAA